MPALFDFESARKELSKKPLPRHIAVIMDGNGRWAKERGLPRVAGHHEGVKSVKAIVEGCGELGVEVLTLYAFSHENWNRPTWEVSALMKLLMRTIHNEINNLDANGVRVRTIGQIDRLPPATLKQVKHAIEVTRRNTGLVLCLALSYGGRIEILEAARRALHEKMTPNRLDEATFSSLLDTAGLPDPDLVIRTSGEHRISNFLLWQIAYSEIYVTPTYWPDFRKKELVDAILDYQTRERRFGLVSEQVKKKKSK
ncbi:MAG: isoprenyl transferase [Bacteroidetes bacterium]|nr:isoprenyl transferase [Bacteroidota bacterium]